MRQKNKIYISAGGIFPACIFCFTMNYLNLEMIKKQCIIDTDFTDDDKYLEMLGSVAEQLVEEQINESINTVATNNGGTVPEPLLQAMLMIVEYLYNNRGSEQTDIPPVVMYLCKLYRNFKN